jgi:hypothetical protein
LEIVVDHPFISPLNRLQVVERRCGYGGSNEAVAIERHSLGEEQMLEPVALLQRGLHPEVRGTRQDTLGERQDALDVEFVELRGVPVHAEQRELLAQLLRVPVVDVDVD